MNYVPVAVVTGATRGIGKAIASKLSKEGLSCVVIGSTEQSISQIKPQEHLHFVNPFQRHRALAIDLSQWPQWTANCRGKFPGINFESDSIDKIHKGNYRILPKVNEQFWETPRTHYYMSLLVNCAGIAQHSLSLRSSSDQIARIMNLNFASCVSLCNMATKQMMKTVRLDLENKHCIPKYVSPCIINMSSILGEPQMTIPGTTVYSASKAALSQYTRVLTQETMTWGIRAESLSPGLVTGTDMTNEMGPTAKEQLVDTLIGLPTHTPEEIANKVWQIYLGENN